MRVAHAEKQCRCFKRNGGDAFANEYYESLREFVDETVESYYAKVLHFAMTSFTEPQSVRIV